MMIKGRKTDIKEMILTCYPVVIAFFLMCVYLFSKDSMANISGDAAEIWKTIKTYDTERVYGTYVLYKGFNAVYPYVWFYRLAMLFGLNEWFFVKVFYCAVFAYVSAAGLPNMIEILIGKETKHYRRAVLVILCFYFWRYTMALSQFMVDLPCLMYFVLLVNAALHIYKRKVSIWNYVWAGFWAGINLCASGQYTVSAICICIFIVIVTVRKYKSAISKDIGKTVVHFGALAALSVLVKMYNEYYIATFVEGLKAKGAWIPSGSVWLQIGFSRFMETYRIGAGVAIPSHRNAAIFQSELGAETFAQMHDVIIGGGFSMTILEYLKLLLKYPGDFILCYLEKFFLALSPDHGGFHFIPLFIFYTLLFVALYIGFVNCRYIKNIINVKFWIGFAFLWAIVPGLVMVIEPRYCMQIQGLVLALAICSDFIWIKCRNGFDKVKAVLKGEIKFTIKEKKISYPILIYFVFIVFCFLNMSSLYEGIEANSEWILISF